MENLFINTRIISEYQIEELEKLMPMDLPEASKQFIKCAYDLRGYPKVLKLFDDNNTVVQDYRGRWFFMSGSPEGCIQIIIHDLKHEIEADKQTKSFLTSEVC